MQEKRVSKDVAIADGAPIPRKRLTLGEGAQSVVFLSRVVSARGRRCVIKVPTVQWLLGTLLLTSDYQFIGKRYAEGKKLADTYLPDFMLATTLLFVAGRDNPPAIVQPYQEHFVPLSRQFATNEQVMQSVRELAKRSSLMYRETGFAFDLLGAGLLAALPLQMMRDPSFWAFPNVIVQENARAALADIGVFQFGHPATPLDWVVKMCYMPVMSKMQRRVGLVFHG